MKSYVAFQRWWMAERSKVGLATPHWPKEYGGAGLTLRHLVAIADEMARADAPQARIFTISLIHMPGTLFPHGTEEQKRRYLPGVAKGELWCQGFSEPNSGSDLASLRTRAVRDGDHYVINGQKIWSSSSMYADHCLLLTRTDPNAQKHRGITYFIMDMHAPGVEVRPIRQANGRSEFGELFLTDVRIPAENMIGAENNGWRIAQATLGSERGVIAFEGAERQRYEIEAFYRKSLETGAAWLRDDAAPPRVRELPGGDAGGTAIVAARAGGARKARRLGQCPAVDHQTFSDGVAAADLLLYGPDRRGRRPGIRHARGTAFRQPNVRFPECFFRHDRRRDE